MEINNEIIQLLDKIEICPFTGKQYDAIIHTKIKCTCACHNPNSNILHFMACCNNGYIDNAKFRYIE